MGTRTHTRHRSSRRHRKCSTYHCCRTRPAAPRKRTTADGARYPKKSARHLLADARMSDKYQFVAAHASEYPVTMLCRVLGLARSGYYAWRARSVSARKERDQQLTRQIQTIFTDSRRTYGSPRVHAHLQAQGIRTARKRVARLMRQAQLCARARRRSVRTTDSRHTEPIAPNLLARTFQAEAPDRVWVADITYLPTREGWLYLAVDLHPISWTPDRVYLNGWRNTNEWTKSIWPGVQERSGQARHRP